ncbi:MAG TPA: AAA family ATPase [Candidatus Nitrosotalea sp.]|nr:AAA family ATPase [Candidatus Nitrosotalea sp.]
MKVITGNPGTGKHTVAARLARELGLELVDINKMAISEGLAEKAKGALDVDVAKLKKVIEKKVPKGALVVGHLAPYVVPRRRVEVAVVLRRSPYELERVYKKRKYDRKKMIENLGSEILGVTYYDTVKGVGRKKTFQIDTTGRSVADTARRIKSLFAKKRLRQDSVDWLAVVTKRKDLAKFFAY